MFTAAGIDRSIDFGINSGYAVVMGMISATFGGLVADLLCGEKPDLLKRGELYATASAIGGATYIFLKETSLPGNTGLMICVGLVVGIRILSRRKKIQLPEM